MCLSQSLEKAKKKAGRLKLPSPKTDVCVCVCLCRFVGGEGRKEARCEKHEENLWSMDGSEPKPWPWNADHGASCLCVYLCSLGMVDVREITLARQIKPRKLHKTEAHLNGMLEELSKN